VKYRRKSVILSTFSLLSCENLQHYRTLLQRATPVVIKSISAYYLSNVNSGDKLNQPSRKQTFSENGCSRRSVAWSVGNSDPFRMRLLISIMKRHVLVMFSHLITTYERSIYQPCPTLHSSLSTRKHPLEQCLTITFRGVNIPSKDEEELYSCPSTSFVIVP
jgi:hypothetical protein